LCTRAPASTVQTGSYNLLIVNESDSKSPPSSLVMRRTALDRGRVFGLVGIVTGGVYLLLGTSLLVSSAKPIYVFQLVLGAAVLLIGVWRYVTARRALRRFEDRNGPGAGKQ
jgi:hypothetical protein